MKKILFTLLIMFIGIGMVYSQSITVTSPHSGDTWAKGSTHNVTWTKSGTMDANVKITLYNTAGTTLIEVMTMNTPNDGSYSWTIPGSVAVGNYVVRVKTTDNAVSDDSDVFAISAPEAAVINVTSPNSGDTWAKGSTHTITWTKSGTMDANVKITLYNTAGTTLIEVITMNTPNDGSYSWTIPGSVAAGNYIVRVKTTDNAVSDDSEVFEIGPSIPESGCVINVTSPCSPGATATLWEKSSTNIVWDPSFSPGGNVKITMTYANCPGTSGPIPLILFIITPSTPNDGSFSWTTPDVTSAKCYRISIHKPGTECAGSSGVFKVRHVYVIDQWWDKFELYERVWVKIPIPEPDPWWHLSVKEILEKIIKIKRPGPDLGKEVGSIKLILVKGSQIVKTLGSFGGRGGMQWDIKQPEGGIAKFKLGADRSKNFLNQSRGGYKIILKNVKTGKILREFPVEMGNANARKQLR